MNFKGKLRIIKKTWALTKAKSLFRKIFNMTTFEFCWTYDCQNHITKSATNAKLLVGLYLKYVGKQVQGDKFEDHFTTRSIDISCSKDVPTEQNTGVL